MDDNSSVEQLTPLELLTPRTYIRALFAFRTTESTLPYGLDSLVKQIPWLSGRLFPTTQAPGKAPTLEIRWNANETTLILVDKGLITASYEILSAKGMPPAAISTDIWPVPNMIDDALFIAGAPVFAASFFQFADKQGVGLCICMHHNLVDATGFAELVRLWVRNISIAGPGLPFSNLAQSRLERLSEALSTDILAVSSQSPNSLFTSHPEYSRIPPALPEEFPSCTSKLFTIPITRINAIKELLSSFCALVWSGITHVRIHRDSALTNETSQLAIAVNGRRRINAEFSTAENPYFGNAVLYSLVKHSVKDLSTPFRRDFTQSLVEICDAITRSQSSTQINARHIAEVYSFVNCIEDYRTLCPGWDLFSSRDLTITSWADLDLYDMEFGEEIGKPEFVRIPYAEADSVGVILPRKRAVGATDTSDEVLEVIIMLRRDDMDILERDSMWKSLVN